MTKFSRRGLFRTAFASAIGAMGTNAYSGACLAPPNCNAICPYGGDPKSNGTQECNCYPSALKIPNPFATSGSYSRLKNIAPRAFSNTDGGDATNAKKFNGKDLRLNHNTSDTNILVVNGSQFDYMTKSQIAAKGIPSFGEKTFTVGAMSSVQITVSRDAYGRVSSISADSSNCNCTNCCNCNCTPSYCRVCSNCKDCNCDCCNCGDDTGCFVQVILQTTSGYKKVEEIQIGDELVGPDGHHKVVAVAINQSGPRALISPKDDPQTILTEEHIVQSGGAVFCELDSSLLRSKALIRVEQTEGKYYFNGLEDVLQTQPWKFTVLEAPPTRTYSPIVESGHWCYTKGGISVLLCSKHL